jgi:hypothetical protein
VATSAPVQQEIKRPAAYVCPECSAAWDDAVIEAAAWLGDGALLEGFCGCGAFLAWEHHPGGGWTLASCVGTHSTAV